jgi:hypothetical protein
MPNAWTVQHAVRDADIPDGLARFRMGFELLEYLIGLPNGCSVIEIEVDNENGVVDFTAEIPGVQGRVQPMFAKIEDERTVIGRFDPGYL